jgi:hypothetical protein
MLMGDNVIKIVGLCQVNDIIPVIYGANKMFKDVCDPGMLKEIYEANHEAVTVPSVKEMQDLVQQKRPRKKWYALYNMRQYLLFSSLHNRGMGCGGTSPLLPPFIVYLVNEYNTKSGGIFQNIREAYSTLRELIREYFADGKTEAPLLVITPDLNKKMLKRQINPGRIALDLNIEEMIGTYHSEKTSDDPVLQCKTEDCKTA